MNFHLVVVRPFGGYSRGEIVADVAQIAKILKGEHAHAVVRVTTPTMLGA